MRKVWSALAGAVVIALAVAGVASAVNTYDVHVASTSPNKEGSKAKPVPANLNFGYRVGDTEDLRPLVIEQYFIAAEGLQTFPDARPTCTFEQATDPNVRFSPSDLSREVQEGDRRRGHDRQPGRRPNDRTQKLECDVFLTLINISTGDPRYPKTVSQIKKRGGIAIRIDTRLPEGSRCPIPVHEALAAPYYDVKIEGISSAELRFTVPPTARPPGRPRQLRGRDDVDDQEAHGQGQGQGQEAQGRLLLARRPQGQEAHGARDVHRRVRQQEDGDPSRSEVAALPKPLRL